MDAKMRLLQMLTYKRPHKSESEHDFIRRFILPYRPTADGFNNLIVVTDTQARTLFSCHTDTVHYSGGMQEVVYDDDFGHAFKKDGEPLGADDALGVWLLLEMIDAGVPGTYIFHRGEECGGQGSGWVKQHKQDWLQRFDRAIAFDRKDVGSVITHQRSRRCCSDAFADALCAALGMTHEKDTGGVFTDTANYDGLIPECTNVSAGYYDEHTPDEMQDVNYALQLREAALALDWEALPTQRDPTVVEAKSWGRGWSNDGLGYAPQYGRLQKEPALDAVMEMDAMELRQFCWDYPNSAAKHLHALIQYVLRLMPADDDDANLGDDAGPLATVLPPGAAAEDDFSHLPF